METFVKTLFLEYSTEKIQIIFIIKIRIKIIQVCPTTFPIKYAIKRKLKEEEVYSPPPPKKKKDYCHQAIPKNTLE